MKRVVTLRPRDWEPLAMKWMETVLAPEGQELFLAEPLRDRLHAWAAIAHIVGDAEVRYILCEIINTLEASAATECDDTVDTDTEGPSDDG